MSRSSQGMGSVQIARSLLALLFVLAAVGCAHQDLSYEIIPGAIYSEETPENHIEAAKSVLNELGIEATLESAIEAHLIAQLAANPELRRFEAVTREFLKTHLGWQSLKGDFIALYVLYYSQRELEELLAFFSLPIGKKMIALQPDLIEKGVELGRRRVFENIEGFQKQIQKQIESETSGER